jgi:spore germination cell wall hydrolase CwlJ-like protein
MKQCAAMSIVMMRAGQDFAKWPIRLAGWALVGCGAPALAMPVADAPVDVATLDSASDPLAQKPLQIVAVIAPAAAHVHQPSHIEPPRRAAPALLVAAAPLVDFTAIYSRAATPATEPEAPVPQYAPDKPFRFDTPNKPRAQSAAVSRFALPPSFGQQFSGSQFSASGSSDFDRALDCMTMAIAYEAGFEPVSGMESVGQVILNRTHSARYPKSVCGVVFQGAERRTGCQFTFTCDGALRRVLSDETLNRARLAASAVLGGATADHVAGATNYHADYVLPYWAATGTRTTKIGAHIFYRMPGDTGFSASAGMLSTEPELALARSPAPPPSSPAAPRGIFAPWGLPISKIAQK